MTAASDSDRQWSAFGKLMLFFVLCLGSAGMGALYIYANFVPKWPEPQPMPGPNPSPWPNPTPDPDYWYRPSAAAMRCLPNPYSLCDGVPRRNQTWRWQVNQRGEYKMALVGWNPGGSGTGLTGEPGDVPPLQQMPDRRWHDLQQSGAQGPPTESGIKAGSSGQPTKAQELEPTPDPISTPKPKTTDGAAVGPVPLLLAMAAASAFPVTDPKMEAAAALGYVAGMERTVRPNPRPNPRPRVDEIRIKPTATDEASEPESEPELTPPEVEAPAVPQDKIPVASGPLDEPIDETMVDAEASQLLAEVERLRKRIEALQQPQDTYQPQQGTQETCGPDGCYRTYQTYPAKSYQRRGLFRRR